MSSSESEVRVPAHLVIQIEKSLAQLVHASQYQTASALAAGIIAASGRAHSIEEALAVAESVHFAMHPNPGFGRYQEWAKTRDATVKKVHT